MTKTFTPVVSHRFAKQDLPFMTPLGNTVDGLFVWNFEFGLLGIVCDLVFGAWNLFDLH